MEGTIRGLIDALSQHSPEGTGENHGNLMIHGVPAEITIEDNKNTKQELHRYLSVTAEIKENVAEIIMNFKSV
jgi:hypothetical protein